MLRVVVRILMLFDLQRRHGRPGGQSSTGFVLPMALIASFALLLCCASFQSFALFRRLQAKAEVHDSNQRDALTSAAMDFLRVASESQQACLVAERFPSPFDAPSRCPDSDSDRFEHGHVGKVPWTLLMWQPGEVGAQLHLALPTQEAAASFSLMRVQDGFRLREGFLRLSFEPFQAETLAKEIDGDS